MPARAPYHPPATTQVATRKPLKDNQPVLVPGSPGGRTLINTILQTIVNRVDHHMTLARRASDPVESSDS
ncbi:MAG TPA: gamma-glutamyltransferase [Verrucomicrobiota bacterium]|nr:gamma-glutamyltransferase [Verrucomicrobiota bacterium]HNU50086.1 gamma-glutamyltransferase [Verrucomicrobiota bacterium]